METTRHSLMDNKVQLYMRPNSPHWQCSCSVGGKQRRATTKEESLARAKDVARDWYLTLLGKLENGEPIGGKSFNEAANQFLKEISIFTEEDRSKNYAYFKKLILDVHLRPFFGDKVVTQITPGLVQDYRVHRMTSRLDKKGQPVRPARNTIHQEIVTLRQVLKTANRHGWLPYLPDLSTPYKANSKVGHRAWFSPEEWKAFYTRTGERAKNPPKERWKKECEDFHDLCLIMCNTGLRPDEAKRIQFRDVAIVTDEATGKRILEIAVRGKRGTGWCKSMPGAVWPYQRLCARNNFQPKDHVFAKRMREQMNAVLEELDMKHDREGNPRSAYSFRHTYISMRLSEGADIYQIAKNCRTSVEMIEKHYAIHIKNLIDTASINVRKTPLKPQNSLKRSKKSTE